MLGDYKIYYNDSYLIITSVRPQMKEKFDKVFAGESAISDFLQQSDILFDSSTHQTILLLTERPGDTMCQLMETWDIVIAGGGIVFNEKDELLLIFRRGKWDLPKGKIELHETILKGAIREVVEETGVQILQTEGKPIITYHAYYLKNKNCLKQTEWFVMKAMPGQTDLLPQAEEDIEKAVWVPRHQISQYRKGCYPLIWDLIKEYSVS